MTPPRRLAFKSAIFAWPCMMLSAIAWAPKLNCWRSDYRAFVRDASGGVLSGLRPLTHVRSEVNPIYIVDFFTHAISAVAGHQSGFSAFKLSKKSACQCPLPLIKLGSNRVRPRLCDSPGRLIDVGLREQIGWTLVRTVPTLKELGYDVECSLWAAYSRRRARRLRSSLREETKKAVAMEQFAKAIANISDVVAYFNQPEFASSETRTPSGWRTQCSRSARCEHGLTDPV